MQQVKYTDKSCQIFHKSLSFCQSYRKTYPVIFDTADKRLRFGVSVDVEVIYNFHHIMRVQVSDAGEFIDSVYREQESSKFFSKMIGRHYIEPHIKSVYTASDVVCEGYLFKKGSWKKNW